MNHNDRLQKAFEYVRVTFFPRWDRNKKWIVRLNHDLPSIGRCNHETKSIEISYISDDDDKLYLLLIHEICHALQLGHAGIWQARMLKASEKAKEISHENLSEMLKKEVDGYIRSPKVTAKVIYFEIYDAIMDVPTVKYHDLIEYMARQYGQYPTEFEKNYKKCREVYEAARKEVCLMKESQALLKKRLLGE